MRKRTTTEHPDADEQASQEEARTPAAGLRPEDLPALRDQAQARRYPAAVLPGSEVRLDGIITQERLMELCKTGQKAALRRRLRKAGIPFKEPPGGTIFTTQGALDAAMVGHAKKKATPNWNAGHASD